MANAHNSQTRSGTSAVETYTLASLQRPANKRIADLEWRIKFTQMKLNLWHDLDNGEWTRLKELHEAAVHELRQLNTQLG
ncbi:MAG: hypothetical protein HKN36_13560 [Hellea sp.]|nr:hypothetical protein [Hellea sp.]